MSAIVCAIRGGPASKTTLGKAVELAQVRQQPLYLLYVINLEFLSHTVQSRVSAIREEMAEMGEMILLLAQESAAAANVATYLIVREGAIETQIVLLCREVDADTVVLGKPLRGRDTANFTNDQLRRFGERLMRTCQAELVVVL